MEKSMKKIMDYITNRYGSVHAFKLLKYLLEHKLARESKGYAIYELSFKIAPSEVLTRYALIRIECLADGAEEKDAEAGLDLLLQKGILTIDPQTEILELNVSVDSVADVYLKKTDNSFEVVADRSSADVILLPTSKAQFPMHQKDDNQKANVAGVPDLLCRNENGAFSLIEIKLYKSTSPNIRTLSVRQENG